jgi:hypothetical protein
MKKVLLTFVLLNCFTIIFAQEWAPIGAKWTYTGTYYMSSTQDTFLIKSIGDTIIQAHQCKILVMSHGNCNTVGSTMKCMYSDSSKVYFFDQSRNIFQMLYNFNANVGYTYKLYPSDFPQNDSIVVIVDSVSAIVINSVVLKKMFVHRVNSSMGWSFIGGAIIENIGDLSFMFPWVNGFCDASWAGPLRCYTDTVIGFHDFGTAPSCDYVFIGIKENNKFNNVSISPNPFSQSTQINLNKSYHNIALAVYDIQCKQVAQQQYADCDKIQLNRNQLSNGLYFLKLTLDDKAVVAGKIVISE